MKKQALVKKGDTSVKKAASPQNPALATIKDGVSILKTNTKADAKLIEASAKQDSNISDVEKQIIEQNPDMPYAEKVAILDRMRDDSRETKRYALFNRAISTIQNLGLIAGLVYLIHTFMNHSETNDSNDNPVESRDCTNEDIIVVDADYSTENSST